MCMLLTMKLGVHCRSAVHILSLPNTAAIGLNAGQFENSKKLDGWRSALLVKDTYGGMDEMIGKGLEKKRKREMIERR